MATTLIRELERLTHSGLELAEPAMDVRGREVRDRGGNHVGTVADLLIDPAERRVRMVELETDGTMFGIGSHRKLVPLEAITSADPRTIYVNATEEEILALDDYRPAEGDAEEAQYLAAYGAYGLTPYWAETPAHH